MKNPNPVIPICIVLAILFASCGKHESPAPIPTVQNDTLAIYTGVSFSHNTGSSLVYDSVSHNTVPQPWDDSLYRPDTLIVTRLGQDSIRLSGSLLLTATGPVQHFDFENRNDNIYTHEYSSHSRYIFRFINNYDSLSSNYILYSGISSAQFVQNQTFFNCRKN